jgi:ABC-type nitrate/sulfonate/bicarbonate transport system permease component
MLFQIRGRLSQRADHMIGAGAIAFLLLVWCILTYGGLVIPFILPSPTRIWEGLAEFHERHWLLPAVWASFVRVTAALFLVVALGVPTGVLMGAFAPIDAALRTIINGIKSVPTTGLIALVVLWFGIDETGKVVYLFLGAFFYLAILTKNAIRSVNEDYLGVALDVGVSRRQAVTRVLLPGALPQIWDAIAVCNGIMWTYIVLAEYMNSNEEQLGLGYLLQMGTRTQQSGKVFGMLIIIAAISSATDHIFQIVRRRFLNW